MTATASPLPHLLTSAPAGRHFAQLHKSSEQLAQAVAGYADAGLKRGERVIMLVVPEHSAMILAELAGRDWSPEAFLEAGQLVILDAQATLNQFMRNGMPEWSAFRRTIGKVLESGRTPFTGTRAYGEMVNVLWRSGSPAAAVRLEEFWNDLAREYEFSLFCCYTVNGAHDDTYGHPLHEIGRTHSDVIPTPDDQTFQSAVDAACRDILGNALSMTLSLSGREQTIGEHRLPAGHRTMLWLRRNMPAIYTRVLERTRQHYDAMVNRPAS